MPTVQNQTKSGKQLFDPVSLHVETLDSSQEHPVKLSMLFYLLSFHKL